MKFIFTCHEEHRKLTVYEFEKFDGSFRFNEWLDGETGLAETELNSSELSSLIRISPIIFVRHIFKIDSEFYDCEGLHDALKELAMEQLDITQTYSVQIRGTSRPLIPLKNLSREISDILTNTGYTLDIKNSEQALSLFITSGKIYAGADSVVNNLSKWKGGMPRYAHSEEYEFVSRAEYKLLEAADCFGLDYSSYRTALDLGAAPGGWTKVLAERGVKVTSVDPNKLEPELLKNKNVRYYSMTAERFFNENPKAEFDLIVNDMKMDADKSLSLALSAFRNSKAGAAVVTLKLPHVFAYKHLRQLLNLPEEFAVWGARQLYHNRSEITLIIGQTAAQA